jgi:hypothetical protein
VSASVGPCPRLAPERVALVFGGGVLSVKRRTLRFSATVHKLGINPCVDVPSRILTELRAISGKRTGPVPVVVSLSGERYRTTIVKYAQGSRLYLNTDIRRRAKVDVGDRIGLEVQYDGAPRVVPMPPRFAAALARNEKAKVAFESLTPSHRKDILSYLNSLKTEESLERNIPKAIAESLAGSAARRPRRT